MSGIIIGEYVLSAEKYLTPFLLIFMSIVATNKRMPSTQSDRLVEKIQKDFSVERHKTMLTAVPFIPVVLFVIAVIYILIVSPADLIPNLLGLLLTMVALMVSLGMLGYAFLGRAKDLFIEAVKKPRLLILGILLNVAYFTFIAEPPFTKYEIADFKKVWYIFVGSWLLFPILKSEKVERYISQNKEKAVLPVILYFLVSMVVYLTAMIFIIVDVMAVFAGIFDAFVIIACSIFSVCN